MERCQIIIGAKKLDLAAHFILFFSNILTNIPLNTYTSPIIEIAVLFFFFFSFVTND